MYSTLSWSARNGQLECARLLVAAGADRAKKTTHRSMTALAVAWEQGHTEIVVLLEQADREAGTAAAEEGTPPVAP